MRKENAEKKAYKDLQEYARKNYVKKYRRHYKSIQYRL